MSFFRFFVFCIFIKMYICMYVLCVYGKISEFFDWFRIGFQQGI